MAPDEMRTTASIPPGHVHNQVVETASTIEPPRLPLSWQRLDRHSSV
jgi:hypothetical protein